MTIKNSRRNISAEPGDIVIDVTQNTLTKSSNTSNFTNNLILTITQQDFIDERKTAETKTLEIPMSEVVRLAYLQNNYYNKTTSNTRFGVSVDKQETAETGFATTYVVKQNGAQVGEKINIPKDFLVKSASLKTSTANGSPVSGINKNDKYIDFVINAKDNSDTNTHVYLNVKDLVDVYTADESTLTLSNSNQFSVKDGSINTSQLSSEVMNIINNKLNKSAVSNSLNSDSTTNALSAKQGKVLKTELDTKASTSYVDDQILGILDPQGTIKLEIASKADADHKHGNITNGGALSQTNGIVITDGNGKITGTATIPKSKISNFTHSHTTADSTEGTAFTNIGSAESATQHTINSKINTALSKKVDKVSGKDLSTNDFTDDLLTKLNGIAEGANKYTHPSYTARTGKPTANQAPAFGGTATVSQIVTNGTGHVTAANDFTITIPSTTATTTKNGLMTTTQVTKLNGIAEEANKYVHPSYTARTGKPTGAQEPAFGGTATISQITSDATGHITAMTDRTIKIPSSTAVAGGANGLMTGADKTKLDGIATGATKNTASSTTPKDLASSANVGSETNYARGDHVHKLPPNATTSNNGLMTKQQVAALEQHNLTMVILRDRDGNLDGADGIQLSLQRNRDKISIQLIPTYPYIGQPTLANRTIGLWFYGTLYTHTTDSQGISLVDTRTSITTIPSGKYLATAILKGVTGSYPIYAHKILNIE